MTYRVQISKQISYKEYLLSYSLKLHRLHQEA